MWQASTFGTGSATSLLAFFIWALLLGCSSTAVRHLIGTRTSETHLVSIFPIFVSFISCSLSRSTTWHFVPVCGEPGRLAMRLTYDRLNALLPCPRTLCERPPMLLHLHPHHLMDLIKVWESFSVSKLCCKLG